jgi:hypothetical protein
VEEWPSICNFIMLMYLEFESVLVEMASYVRLQTMKTQQPHLEFTPSKYHLLVWVEASS